MIEGLMNTMTVEQRRALEKDLLISGLLQLNQQQLPPARAAEIFSGLMASYSVKMQALNTINE